MQERFRPGARRVGSLALKQVRNGPEVFAGVMEVQNVNGLAEPVLRHVPEPDGAIDDDVTFARAGQAPPPSLRLHRRPKVHRLGIRCPNHDVLLDQHPPPRRLLNALVQPVNDRRFDLLPIHPIRLLLAPARPPIYPALPGHPPVHHEDQ